MAGLGAGASWAILAQAGVVAKEHRLAEGDALRTMAFDTASKAGRGDSTRLKPVSYKHLTLPTISTLYISTSAT